MTSFKIISKVDMRTKSFDVPPQEILTKDSVTVTVDAVIYYKVRDANGKSYHTEPSNPAKSISHAEIVVNCAAIVYLGRVISLQKLQSKISRMSIRQLECLLKRH